MKKPIPEAVVTKLRRLRDRGFSSNMLMQGMLDELQDAKRQLREAQAHYARLTVTTGMPYRYVGYSEWLGNKPASAPGAKAEPFNPTEKAIREAHAAVDVAAQRVAEIMAQQNRLQAERDTRFGVFDRCIEYARTKGYDISRFDGR